VYSTFGHSHAAYFVSISKNYISVAILGASYDDLKTTCGKLKKDGQIIQNENSILKVTDCFIATLTLKTCARDINR